MKRRAVPLRAACAVLMLGGLLTSARSAKAADLDELTKYLAFIEGFQYIFEYCQAETALPETQVAFARRHIGERRALIFSGLDEMQREKLITDMPPKRSLMIKAMLDDARRDPSGMPLKDLCKQGLFEGVIDSEQKSAAREVAAIEKAKN